MENPNAEPNYQTATTTASSAADGRLKVDVGGMKKKIIKKQIKKHAR